MLWLRARPGGRGGVQVCSSTPGSGQQSSWGWHVHTQTHAVTGTLRKLAGLALLSSD